MEDPVLLRRLEMLSDNALVRALTLERADYRPPFIVAARAETERRGLDLDRYIDRVSVSMERMPERNCEIAHAVDIVRSAWPIWQLRTFRHCFDHALAVQREVRDWSVHYYEGTTYCSSFFLATQTEVALFVSRFLRLEHQPEDTPTRLDLDGWYLLISAGSPRYVQRLAHALHEVDILHTVQTATLTGDEGKSLRVRVPAEAKGRALETLHGLEADVRALYRRANAAFAADDVKGELAIYAQLIDYGLDNPAVFYNFGAALYESGAYAEAGESFVEALSLWMVALDERAQRSAAPSGGLMGLLQQSLSGRTPVSPQQRALPDQIEDVECWLFKVRQHLPHHTNILRALASTAAVRNDVESALSLYRDLLTLDADDAEAIRYVHEQEQI